MMTRTIILISMSTAACAAAAIYLVVQPVAPTELASADEWPICTTMASLADNADWAQLDDDFAAGKKAMAVGDWSGAVRSLKSAALRDPRNADIQNYLGYSYRRLREPQPAIAHFQQALAYDARHRAAHEHMGEIYLTMGDVAAAEQHLAALEGICLIPCDEYGDLQRAITAYKKSVH
jgi:Flp pilus assembly protein TadD